MLSHCHGILLLMALSFPRASAQSEARIFTRQDKRRSSRYQSGIFIVAYFLHVHLITGWKGYLRLGRFSFKPVIQPFPACHQSSFVLWVTGSTNKKSLSHGLSYYRSSVRSFSPVCLLIPALHRNYRQFISCGCRSGIMPEWFGDWLETSQMIRTTRHRTDRTPEIAITMTARQLDAVIVALRELDMTIRYSYNRLTPDDKCYAKKALKELRRSKALDLLEWSQFAKEGKP